MSGKVGVCFGHSGPVTPLPIPAAGAHRGYHFPAPHPCPEGPALCSNPQQGMTAARRPGPTCSHATPALSFTKFKSRAPSSSHTSWMPFNRGSPWKVRFTCRRRAPRSMPALPVHDPSLLLGPLPTPPASPPLLHPVPLSAVCNLANSYPF